MVALFVALMFVSFILVDVVIQKLGAWRLARARFAAASSAQGIEDWLAVPEGFSITNGHAWVLPLQEGTVRAGADPMLAKALGQVGSVVLPSPGERVVAGQPLFQLVLAGRSISVPAPASGRIAAVNDSLSGHPSLVAQDPYGRGWVCSIEQDVASPAPSPSPRRGTQAALWLEKEVARFREFLSVRLSPDLALGMTSQDGGVLLPGVLAQFDAEVWAAFELEFLNQH